MKAFFLSIPVALLSLVSCNRTSGSTNDKLPYRSFEVTNKGDTIKIVDGNGMKQGLWLMPVSKDTVVYLNDTAHSVTNMTSGEMLRLVKEKGNEGILVLPDDFGVQSK